MPNGTFSVVPQATGDFLGAKSGAAAPSNVAQGAVGHFGGLFPAPAYDQGWMGRFEVSVPNGATITAASLTHYHSVSSVGCSRMTGGVLKPDGLWNVSGGTFSVSKYASINALPWPEGAFGASPDPDSWYESTPAFSLETFYSATANTLIGIGEGVAVEHPVTGLVAKIQSYLNVYGPTLRPGSISGTDLPIALCWYRQWAPGDEQFTVLSSLTASPAQRPTLYLEWVETIVPSRVSAKLQTQPIISARKEMR